MIKEKKQKMNRQTPLEKLISDKKQIEERCHLQKKILNSDFTYIQENSTALFFSGITSLIFHKSKPTQGTTPSSASDKVQPLQPLGFSDIISIGKGMLPVLWDITKPLLISWGIKKAVFVFSRALLGKKKR